MKVKIRDFIENDRGFFMESCIDFYDTDAVTEVVDPKNFERTFNLCIEGNPYTQGMIFEVDGNQAGYALLSFTYSNEVGGLAILIEEAYILSKYQGKGIGSSFFDMIEERYVKYGKAKRIRLEVSKSNKSARALYERLGYKELKYVQMVKNYD